MGQEQEAEMKLRQEQAKQQYMMQMQHQQQAYAAAQQGMMQPPGAPGMPPYGQPYPPPMHYPPYMGQPGIGGAPTQGTAGSPMHGGDPSAAAFNMQGMAGALPPMAPSGQMTPQGGPPHPQGCSHLILPHLYRPSPSGRQAATVVWEASRPPWIHGRHLCLLLQGQDPAESTWAATSSF